jgi:ADP-ribosyl-[dinitrogen reductase] hydrolase
MATPLEKATGSLLGLICGDALGSTVEFASSEEIYRNFGSQGQTEMCGGGAFNWKVGEYTDDGQMMMCLLESLNASNAPGQLRGLNLLDLGQRFLDWYDSNPPDVGRTTRMSLRRLKEGVPPQFSGDDDPKSQANGAVMRCVPVAVLWHRPEQRTELVRDSLLQAYPTHRSEVAAGACVVVNSLVAEFIHGTDIEIAMARAAESSSPEWQKILKKWEWKGRPHEGNSGWAVSTVLTALHCLLTTTDFESAVVKAVNGGDDADTVGAVTGSLAGAYYGENSIPSRWLMVLKDRDSVRELGTRLFKLS